MNKQELIAHLRAYSATYYRDASLAQAHKDHARAQFDYGKSEAFATAAAWLEVSGV